MAVLAQLSLAVNKCCVCETPKYMHIVLLLVYSKQLFSFFDIRFLFFFFCFFFVSSLE